MSSARDLPGGVEVINSSQHSIRLVGGDDESAIEDVAPPNAQPAMRPVSRNRQMSILLCAFFDVFVTIGMNQAYGVFLSYYLADGSSGKDPFLPRGETTSKAMLAFVGTLAAGLTWGGSIFVNPIMARCKDPRWITGAGAIFIGAGYVLASFCHTVWQLLLTQGLIYGIGTSLVYFPVMAVAPEYFDAHRGSAMGLILSGAGIGGLAYAPAARVMLARVGAAWTLRTLGLVNFAICIPIVLATPSSRSLVKRPTLVDVRLAKRPIFILQAVAAMAQAAGNLVPLTFLPEFSTRLGYSAAFGAALLAINNAVNTISRIGMGLIADVAGRQNTLVLSVLGSAITVVAFWLSSAYGDDLGLWIAFVVTYGIFAGGYNSLFPTTVIEVFGPQAYASVNGFIYFIRGLGALWGSPVGGALVKGGTHPQAYITLIWYDFALLMLTSVCVIMVRGLDALDKGQFKLKA
ncbi:MFS transporter, MCP family, solute carrier family 16, member 10 [Exophiala viscosa]|uniref:MFS transporter, MCP family, solute carrier family 16, member 10 n=1 Tax=Exophiala viscosa TaxID=2486360 RepID=A0AAN6DV68_9EURO|nr:MFS transporter, MCP family, solute carrier family 16, member 10 [Exophiala viscosa]